jgi:general secretion pathway protein C
MLRLVWPTRASVGRVSPYRVAFWVLAVLLAVQGVRLFWTIVTPVGPVGKWHGARPLAALAGAPGFDPFFRLAGGGAGQATVTSLALKLFGTRIDYASGRGAAIIATPDGVQSSFAVGEEIVPGVKLKQVALEYVVLDRGGQSEQLFIDQSVTAPVVSPTGAPSAPGGPVTAQNVQDLVAIIPRIDGTKVTGLALTPKGDAAAFRAAGLEPGDVLVAVDGRPVQNIADFGSLPVNGSGPVLQVERAGRTITVNAKAPQ